MFILHIPHFFIIEYCYKNIYKILPFLTYIKRAFKVLKFVVKIVENRD